MRTHSAMVRRALTIASALAMVLSLMFIVHAPASAAGSCTVAPLAGSSFEGGDGDLTSSCATDWDKVSPLYTGIDKPSGATDNSFGQGAKEDSISPTIVSGSIPPNKNDLTPSMCQQRSAPTATNSCTWRGSAW